MSQRFRLPCPFCSGVLEWQDSRQEAVVELHDHMACCGSRPGNSQLVQLISAARNLVAAHNESFDQMAVFHKFRNRKFSPKLGSLNANVGRLDAALLAFDSRNV